MTLHAKATRQSNILIIPIILFGSCVLIVFSQYLIIVIINTILVFILIWFSFIAVMVNVTSIIPSWNLSILTNYEVPRRTDVLITCVKIIFRIRWGLLLRLWKGQSPRTALLRTYSPDVYHFWVKTLLSQNWCRMSRQGWNKHCKKIAKLVFQALTSRQSALTKTSFSLSIRHCHHLFVNILPARQSCSVCCSCRSSRSWICSLEAIQVGCIILYAEQVNVLFPL